MGVAFLVVVALLLGLTVAIYNKAFTKIVPVTLQASSTGNQLNLGRGRQGARTARRRGPLDQEQR